MHRKGKLSLLSLSLSTLEQLELCKSTPEYSKSLVNRTSRTLALRVHHCKHYVLALRVHT